MGGEDFATSRLSVISEEGVFFSSFGGEGGQELGAGRVDLLFCVLYICTSGFYAPSSKTRGEDYKQK